MKKKIVFFGSSDFSAEVLKYLIDTNHEIVLLITQPDKPFGRKRKLKATRAKEIAIESQIEVYQPNSLKKLDPFYKLRDLDYDFGVVVAYGKIIPQRILDTASISYLNGHASDLPRWRGAAPIERAIMSGDSSTAMCIMKMTAALDEGDVLFRDEVKISDQMGFKDLENKLLESCKINLEKCIHQYKEKLSKSCAQSIEGITYAEKIYKDVSYIKISSDSAITIYNRIRGLENSYGAVFSFEGKKFAVYSAKLSLKDGLSGQGGIIDLTKKSFGIALKGGVLYPQEVQLEGKKRMAVQSFMSGSRLDKETCFESFEVKNG
ncbi:MAG: methionyl-tRNA formyltransferase [Candidatus Cloacimonadota bacterium]|nr:MAG: methionyl-tRNA formyltransferase [Candidatus Cloacimonadota bacterium]